MVESSSKFTLAFIYDSFWRRAIPEQEKREIDKETGLDGPGIIKFIRDPFKTR